MKIHLKKLSDFVYPSSMDFPYFTLRAGGTFPDRFLHHHLHPAAQLPSRIHEQ